MALILLGAILVAGGLVGALREVVPVLMLSSGQADTFWHFERLDVQPPVASASVVAELNECYAVATSVYGRAQTTPNRTAFLDGCLSRSESAVLSSPVLAAAWAIDGALAILRGDTARFNSSLVRSSDLSPHEQWLAEFRVQTVETNIEAASPGLLSTETRDLQTLAASNRGIISISQRYINDAGFRGRVTQAIEAEPKGIQQKFVGEIRYLMSQTLSTQQ